ncbi:maleylacetoacetate isomerase [Salinimonas marina]|uniref:Maleylacetoacetate isomerase n=1 Tax=Salinimonas marina TaxID=2785918 RepID=A0A7S9HC98_9ALTE|nr:maleylacetoacetate isomerase [Salinimonas marina]QPG04894.1 maleylacetoacetate isomerase [Salinimonas marina]
MALKLYGYWRSTASYRVRIALNLKQLEYEYVPIHLVNQGGEQHQQHYLQLNPAALVPTLADDDEDIILNQSLSIIEYLDERYDQGTRLLPCHTLEKARVRALAQDIACDIQPLGNLRVMQALETQFGVAKPEQLKWAAHWIHKGFSALEQRLATQSGNYCFDFAVSLADVCLVPQAYNAKRFGINLETYPQIHKVVSNCEQLEAFVAARPENQPDAPPGS